MVPREVRERNALYSLLLTVDPSPIVRLNRAIVIAQVQGPKEALLKVDTLRDVLDRYHLYHATRAALLSRAGRTVEARASDARALRLATNPAERALLEHRLTDA